MTTLTVIKQDYQGNETWRYEGRLIERRPHSVKIEAYFDKEDTQVDKLILRKGDRFIETYFDDRWYNIFEIFDRENNQRKGWYCNISKPAQISENIITFQDLALDLLVYNDGHQTILDMEEFDSLTLPAELRQNAYKAVAELRSVFNQLEQSELGESNPPSNFQRIGAVGNNH